MTVFYPVSLNLEGRPCVVVGGGEVAEQKVLGLLKAGARVTVISPRATRRLTELAAEGALHVRPRPYQPGDLEGAFLAVVAAEDRAVNHAVWEEAEQRGVLLNAVDDMPHCHFIAPAIYQQGDLAVAVSTAGKSPALAVRVRDRIGALIGREYGAFLDLLGGLRPDVAARVPDGAARAALWHRIVDSDVIEFIHQGDIAGARNRIAQLLDTAERDSTASGPAGRPSHPGQPS